MEGTTNQSNQQKTYKAQPGKRVLIALSCLFMVVLLVIYGVILSTNILSARKSLYQGRGHLESAYVAAEKADFGESAMSFKQAKTSFINANKILARPSIKLLMPVPILNKNLQAIKRLTSAGFQVSLAGESLAKASMFFPQKQGKIDLSFNGGKVDLQPFLSAKPYIDQANLYTLQAMAEYEKAPSTFLIPSIDKAREELGKQLPKLRDITTNMKLALDVLPGVLGSQTPRRYFLAIQNNAELRATGGLIGNYGIITMDKGKLSLTDFNEILKLQNMNPHAVNAPKDYLARYGQFQATSIWSNTNMSPDFPTVSRILLNLYGSVTGVSLDGVITIDPVGLQYLLTAIGPVDLPGESIIIDEHNVVNWTLIDAYAKYTDRDQRKDFLADVARAVWLRVISGQIENKSKLVDQLNLALSEKHMAVYSTDSKEQELAESLGYGGVLLPTANDYVQVIMQNHGANKIDVYMHEEIRYSIKLRPDGSGLARMSINVINKTPRAGLPTYVSGDNPQGAHGGSSNTWLNLYVPQGCQLTSMDSTSSQVDIGAEKDKTVFSQYVKLAPSTSRTVDLTYELPNVLVFQGDEIVYALDWQVQPVLNKPDISIDVEAPHGFEFNKLPQGFKRKGKKAVYRGVFSKDQKLELGLIDNR